MSEQDNSIRQRIISSVFDKRNLSSSVTESYVAHIKIWEDAGDGTGKKPRYILLSQTSDGSGLVHKSKLNTNGSFSVGKTWKLSDLKGVEAVTPLTLGITLARTYKWQTENQQDQRAFVSSLISLYETVFGSRDSLKIVGDFGASPQHKPLTNTESSKVSSSSNDIQSTLPSRPSRTRVSEEIPRKVSEPRPSAETFRPTTPNGQTGTNGQPPASLTPGGPRIDARTEPYSPSKALNLNPPSALRPRARRPSASASTAASFLSTSPSPSPKFVDSASSSTSSHRAAMDLPSPAYANSLEDSITQVASPLAITPKTGESGSTEKIVPSAPRSYTTPSRSKGPAPMESAHSRREHNNRISFFDPSNQALLDRLVAGNIDSDTEDGGDEVAQATMLSVEEMLEGYDWGNDGLMNRQTPGDTADVVEARLFDELMALDKANIHSFLESDDRINLVVKLLDEAILEVDGMDSLISSYKIHLNAVSDDITFIQSQRRGLQVQTQNQRALLTEVENLLQTVDVDRESLIVLTQESLEKPAGIQRLEDAVTVLYKALQASQDSEMAATMERLDEYRTYNSQFCKRVFDYLSIMSAAQAKSLTDKDNGLLWPNGRKHPALASHEEMEKYLGRYAGLLLYLKEMDEGVYSKFCAAYFSTASDLHNKQMKALLSFYGNLVKKPAEEDGDANVTPWTTGNPSKGAGGAIRRAGTIVRPSTDGRRDKDRDKRGDDELKPSEALTSILDQIAPQIYRENDFIADFLQINDAGLTFADYAGLDNYFRRQANRSAGLSQATIKLVRGAMELIFGFLPNELKQWIDNAISKDSVQMVGVIVCLERFLADADERGNNFFIQMLERQHTRLKGSFDRHVNQQMKSVEETKLNSKKRRGVAPFIKYFPTYIARVEQQMIGADGLEIRATVDVAYEKIVSSMFEGLKHMATMDGEGDDKGQLNYHVLLVENMHYFVAEISQVEGGTVSAFLKQAEALYSDNLNAYVKIVLRRPFAKIIDFFSGLDRLLENTAPTEVMKSSSYSRSALKKIVKDFDDKDVRKHIDTLFKRVEKHFTEAEEKSTTEERSGIAAGHVMVGVWKACEEELVRLTKSFQKKIDLCYKDSGVGLEYTTGDIEAAFKRHRLDA